MNAETNSAPAWGSVTYTLLFPVNVDGATVSALTFEEPNGEKLEAIEAAGEAAGGKKIRQTVALLAILSGQPESTIRRLNQRDIKGASEAIVPLLEAISED